MRKYPIIIIIFMVLVLLGCTNKSTTLPIISKQLNQQYNINKSIDVLGIKNQIISKNITYEQCEKIATDYIRDYCYQDIALKRSNVTLCLNLLGSSKDSCIEQITKYKNESYCLLVELTNRDICYLNVATKTNNPKYCENTGFYSNFPALCFMEFAYFTRNSSYCDRVMFNEPYINHIVFGNLGSKSDYGIKSDYEFAKRENERLIKIYGNLTYKQVCEGMAVGKFNSYLSLPETTSFHLNYSDCKVDKDECLLSEISTKKTFNKCNLLEYAGYKISCLAIKENNQTICKENAEHKDLCFFEFAKAQSDLYYCNFINYTILHDRCIALVAFNTA